LSAQSFYAVDFTENKGQWNSDFDFKSTIANGSLFIQKNGYTVVKNSVEDIDLISRLMHGAQETEKKVPVKIKADMMEGESEKNLLNEEPILHSHAYKVMFKGSSQYSTFVTERPTGESANYFLGDDPKRWKQDVKSFGSVVQKGLYQGIDIRYYSNGSQLKYDLIINPGASVSTVVMQYEGADKLSLKDGELIISTSVGESKELAPIAYQIIDAQKKQVECRFQLNKNEVSFKVKSYDPRYALIIDPILIFSTYTGSKSSNWGFTAAPGPDGSLYAGGIVFGSGYPTSPGAFQNSFAGGVAQGKNNGIDVSLTRFSADGKARIFSTYIGGKGDDFPHSIFVDPSGNAVLLGRTTSSDFPTLNNNRLGPLGRTDIFISKISADGKTLIGGVLVGGNGDDGANIDASLSPQGPRSLLYNYGDNARSEVILDKSNNVYIASCSQSPDFPLQLQTQSYGGAQDGVFLKFSPDLSKLIFSTYVGGSDDDAAFVLAMNPVNNDVYVAGATQSSNLPGNFSGTIGTSFQGNIDGFITVFSSSGAISKSTYMGTSAIDIIYGIQFDQNGFPYIMGISLGSWPITKNATFSNPGAKQFISKLKPDLSDYVYSTVFGTAAAVPNISPVAFLVDRCENVYVSGWGGKLNACYQSKFDNKTVGVAGMRLVGNPIQSYTDNKDFYFFVMQKNAASQLYGSFYGQFGGEGDHVDGGTSRFDARGAIYQAVCSNCGGTNICPSDPIRRPFIITPGAVAPTNGALGSATPGECNLAAFKINFDFDGVKSGVKSYINGVFDTSGCSPVTIEFVDTIGIGKQYIWDFGDGTPSVTTTTPEIKHDFSTNVDRVFRVRLITIDTNRCITTDTSYRNVKIGLNKAKLSARAERRGPCGDSVFTFINTSVPPPGASFSNKSFVWQFDDGSPPDTMGLANITHKFSAGTHKVKLTLLEKSFCNFDESIELIISVNPIIKADFKPDDDTICIGQKVNFQNLSVGGFQFAWKFDNGSSSTDFVPPSQVYNTIGEKTIQLIISENSPNCKRENSITYKISVKPNPIAAFDYSPKVPAENTAVNFINLSTGADTFLWMFGDGESSTLKDVNHFYKTSGEFEAKLYASTKFGCVSIATDKVNALVKPLADVPNAFTPNGDGKNEVFYVRGYGISKMNLRVYNRWGQVVFETTTQDIGWDGKVKGIPQPMDTYAYTLTVEFGDGTKFSKKGDLTLIR
jgi:gliding motility-associated-like protein